MALPSLDDSDDFVNVLYLGEPGSGKTTAAAHMAKLGHIIAIDAESGIKRKPLRKLGVPTENIHPYRVSSYADLDTLYWQVKAMLDEDPYSVAGVTFDSFTEIQKKLLESIVKERHDRAVAKAQKIGYEINDDEFETDRDEWGKMTEMCRRVCRRFRDLPCHTAFVCLPKREVDNDGVFYRPALTPAFASDLTGYVDLVIHTVEAEDTDPDDPTRYVGITRNIGKYRGKDRHGATPASLCSPTFDRVVQYVEAEHGEMDNDPVQALLYERLGHKKAAAAAQKQETPTGDEAKTTEETPS